MAIKREKGTVLMVTLAILTILMVLVGGYWKAVVNESKVSAKNLSRNQSMSILRGQFEQNMALYKHELEFGSKAVQLAGNPYNNLPEEQPELKVVMASTGFEVLFPKTSDKKKVEKNEDQVEPTEFIIKGGGTIKNKNNRPVFDKIYIQFPD